MKFHCSQHMKTHILFCIFFVFLILSCSAQTERIESNLMECTLQSYADGGIELKNIISDYQTLLINEGFLKDVSAKSYRGILEKMAVGNGFEKEPSKFFILEIRNIEQPDLDKIKQCQQIKWTDSTSYLSSKLKRFENIFDPNNPNITKASSVAKEMLEVLTIEDFELEYYRLRTFFIFSYIDTDADVDSNITVIKNPTNEQKQRSLKIELNHQSDIIFKGNTIDKEQLSLIIREYYSKNKSKSILTLKSDKDAIYGAFEDVQQIITLQINKLKTELAKSEFQKSLKELNKEQMDLLDNTYPLVIIE